MTNQLELSDFSVLPLVKNYSVYDDEIVPILSRLEIPTLDILPVFPIH